MTTTVNPQLDERDAAILIERQAAYDARTGIHEGDLLRFSDGTERRVAHVWREADGTPFSVQPTDGTGPDAGSFHLGDYGMSHSGGLRPGIDPTAIAATEESAEVGAWFFRHDRWKAHNGVPVRVRARVFTVSA